MAQCRPGQLEKAMQTSCTLESRSIALDLDSQMQHSKHRSKPPLILQDSVIAPYLHPLLPYYQHPLFVLSRSSQGSERFLTSHLNHKATEPPHACKHLDPIYLHDQDVSAVAEVDHSYDGLPARTQWKNETKVF